MTKQTKSITLLFIGLVLTMGMLMACTANSNVNTTEQGESGNNNVEEEQIEIRVAWWGSQSRHDITLEAIRIFEEKNPDIKIVPEFGGFDGYWEKMGTQGAGGNLPDIITLGIPHINEYVSRELIRPIDPYIESGIIDLTNVDELTLSGGMADGKLYGMNLGSNAPTVIYDPAMFEEMSLPELEPGYTWEEYMNIARTAKQSMVDDQYFYGIHGLELHAFRHYIRQHELELFSEDKTDLGYDEDQIFIDYHSMWMDLLNEGIAPKPDVTQGIQGLEDALIIHGKSPVLPAFSNQLVVVESSAERSLEMALLPSLTGGVEGHFVRPSQTFAITTHSENPEAAAKFIDFFTNDLEANTVLGGERGVPISSVVREHLYPNLDSAGQKMFDFLELVEQNSRPAPPLDPPGYNEISRLYLRIIEALEYEQVSVEEAAKQFREESKVILSR